MAPAPPFGVFFASAGEERFPDASQSEREPKENAPSFLAYRILPPLSATIPPLSSRAPHPVVSQGACAASRHHPPLVRHLLDNSIPLPQQLASLLPPEEHSSASDSSSLISAAALPGSSACAASEGAREACGARAPASDSPTKCLDTPTETRRRLRSAKTPVSPRVSKSALTSSSNASSSLTSSSGAPSSSTCSSSVSSSPPSGVSHHNTARFAPLLQYASSPQPPSLLIPPFFSSPATPQRSATALQSELASSALRCRAAELQHRRLLRALAAAVYRAVQPHAANLASIIQVHALAAAADLHASASNEIEARLSGDLPKSFGLHGFDLNGHGASPSLFSSPVLSSSSSPFPSSFSPFSLDGGGGASPLSPFAEKTRPETFTSQRGNVFFRGRRGDVFDFLPVVVAAAGVDAGDHRLAVQLLNFECMRRSRLSWRRWRRRQLLSRKASEASDEDSAGEKTVRRSRRDEDASERQDGVFFFRAAVLRASECSCLAAAVQSIYQQLTSMACCALSQSGKNSLVLPFAPDSQRGSRASRADAEAAHSLFSTVSEQMEEAFFPLLSAALSHEDISTAGAWSVSPKAQCTYSKSLEGLLFPRLDPKGEAPLFPAGTGEEEGDGASLPGDSSLLAAKRFDGICEKLEVWWRGLNIFPENGRMTKSRGRRDKLGVDSLLEEGSLRRAKTRRQKQMKELWGSSDEEVEQEAEAAEASDELPDENESGKPSRAGSPSALPCAATYVSSSSSEPQETPEASSQPAVSPPLSVGTSVFRPVCLSRRGEGGREGSDSVQVSSAVLLVVLEETEAFPLPLLSSLLHLLSILRMQCRMPFVVVAAASSSSAIRQFLCDSRATNSLAVEAATLLQPSLVQQQIVNLLLACSAALPFSLSMPSLLVLLQHLEENVAPSVLQLARVFQVVVRQFYQAHPLAFLCRGFDDVLPLLHAAEEQTEREASPAAGEREDSEGESPTGDNRNAERGKGKNANDRESIREKERETESTEAKEARLEQDEACITTAEPSLFSEEKEKREDAKRLQTRASRLLNKWTRRTELLAFSSITDDHIRLLTQLLRNATEVYVHLVASQQHGGFFFDRCCWQQEQLLQKSASVLGGAGPRVSPLSRRSRPGKENEESEEEEEKTKRQPSGDGAAMLAKLNDPLHARQSGSRLTESSTSSSSCASFSASPSSAPPSSSPPPLSSSRSSFPSFLPGCRRSGACVSRRAVLALLRAWWGGRGLSIFSRLQEDFRERRSALERQRVSLKAREAADEEKLRREERDTNMALICREILPQAVGELAERRVGVALAFRLLLLLQQQLERQRRSGRTGTEESDFSYLLPGAAPGAAPDGSEASRASHREKKPQGDTPATAAATAKRRPGGKPKRAKQARTETEKETDDMPNADKDEQGSGAFSDEEGDETGDARDCWWRGAAEAESGTRAMIDELERLLGVHEENACLLRKTRPQQRVQEMARACRSVGEDLHRLLGTLYEDLAVAAPARVFHDCGGFAEGGIADPSALSLPLKLFFQQGHRELCLLRLFLAARSSPDSVPDASGVHTAEILHALDNLRLLVGELDEASLALAAGPKRESCAVFLPSRKRTSVSPLREAGSEAAWGVCSAGRPGKAFGSVASLSSPDAAPLGAAAPSRKSAGDGEKETMPSLAQLYTLKLRFLHVVEELLLLLLLPLPSWHPLGTELAVWGGSLAIEVAAAGLALPSAKELGGRRAERQLVSAAQTVCARLEPIPQRETLEHLAIVNPFYLQQFEDSEDEETPSRAGSQTPHDAASPVLLEDVSVVYRLLGDAGKRVGMWDLFCAFCRETLEGRIAQEAAKLGDNAETIEEEKRGRSRERGREKKMQVKHFEFEVLSKMEDEGNANAGQTSQTLAGAAASSASAVSSVSLPPVNLLQQLQFRFAVAVGSLDHQLGLLRLPTAGAFAAAAEQALVGGQGEDGELLFACEGEPEEIPEEEKDGESKPSDSRAWREKSKGKRGPSRFARKRVEEDSEAEVAKEVQDELRQMKELLHGVYAHRTQFGTVYVRDCQREIQEEETEDAPKLEKKRRRRKTTNAKKRRNRMEDSS
ncbi:hypothetical protein TGRUB_226890 [Toxoplasma gondii RUB]|uniref:Uncharacterized protein n=1 Tax=Toxoplasma gondii RUB TaxID=935652 RepID=A0A086LWE1_TOXGO|nr:hypothetical protein TGRUB_226890 [Toxoplasma gondii RUB]